VAFTVSIVLAIFFEFSKIVFVISSSADKSPTCLATLLLRTHSDLLYLMIGCSHLYGMTITYLLGAELQHQGMVGQTEQNISKNN